MLVPDASVTLEWFLPKQMSDSAKAALPVARRSVLVVPPIWILETQNVILTLVRRGRFEPEEAQNIRLELGLMSKRVLPVPEQEQLERIWEIANRQMMTFYDACYVEAAWQFGLPIASSDGAIRAAAKALGLKLL